MRLYLAEGEHCSQPGKHPRGVKSWRKESTTDEAAIRDWWTKWPDANIGIDCGKSKLLVLDADAYKDTFAGDHMLAEADEQTPTVISGGGGQHLYYRMPENVTWGNARGNLPHGIDVRGNGGFIVAPPSLHASGRRYVWELAYDIGDLPLAEVPAWLAEILNTSAHAMRERSCGQCRVLWDGVPTTAVPDLARWNLSKRMLKLITHPPAKGQRSEADAAVCTALVAAGATDDDIRSVFEHNPIGTSGKFAERGLNYLARTIDAVRGYVDEHPRPPNPHDLRRILDALRLRLRAISFADQVPVELQAANGYRTNETDRAMADAALSILMEYGAQEGRISALQLSERTGRSDKTCKAAMYRLCWLFEPLEKVGAKDAMTYRLRGEWLSCVDSDRVYQSSVNLSESTQLPLATHRGQDAFVRALSPISAEQLAERNAERNANGEAPVKQTSEIRRRLAATVPSAGPAVLLAVDAIDQYGAMNRAALRAVLFKEKSSVSRLVRRGVQLGLLVENGDLLDVAPYWKELADELAHDMPTAGNLRRRKLAAADSRIRYCDAKLRDENLTADERQMLNRRREQACKVKSDIARYEAPELAQRKRTKQALSIPSAPVRPLADVGLHTPNRNTVAQALQDAAYWNRLKGLTPNQRYFVERANAP